MILKNRLLFCLFTMRLRPELPKYYSYVYMDALLSRLHFQMQDINWIINKDVYIEIARVRNYIARYEYQKVEDKFQFLQVKCFDGKILFDDIATSIFLATLICFESVTFTGATFWHCTTKTQHKFNGFKISVKKIFERFESI